MCSNVIQCMHLAKPVPGIRFCTHYLASQSPLFFRPSPPEPIYTQPPVSLWNISSFRDWFLSPARIERKIYPPMNSWTILQSAVRHWKAIGSASNFTCTWIKQKNEPWVFIAEQSTADSFTVLSKRIRQIQKIFDTK